jgi:hypothetical protein
LADDEYLTGISGRAGDLCDQLQLTSSKGKTKKFGGSGGSPGNCQVAFGSVVVAIGGGYGGHLHNARAWFVLPKGYKEEKGDNWRKSMEQNSFADWKEGSQPFGGT